MCEWQPIETAPKDGTRIIIYSPDRCGNCQDGATGCFIAWFEDGIWYTGKMDFGPYLYAKHSPTHWMPMPELPK